MTGHDAPVILEARDGAYSLDLAAGRTLLVTEMLADTGFMFWSEVRLS